MNNQQDSVTAEEIYREFIRDTFDGYVPLLNAWKEVRELKVNHEKETNEKAFS